MAITQPSSAKSQHPIIMSQAFSSFASPTPSTPGSADTTTNPRLSRESCNELPFESPHIYFNSSMVYSNNAVVEGIKVTVDPPVAQTDPLSTAQAQKGKSTTSATNGNIMFSDRSASTKQPIAKPSPPPASFTHGTQNERLSPRPSQRIVYKPSLFRFANAPSCSNAGPRARIQENEPFVPPPSPRTSTLAVVPETHGQLQQTGSSTTSTSLPSPPESGIMPRFLPAAKSLDHWAEDAADGIQDAPKLPDSGPWEMPLPPNMDTKVHVECHVDRLRQFLHVQVLVRESPPAIKVDLLEDQRKLEHAQPQMIEEHTARRWKAWNILFDWVQHLELRGKPPSFPPLDVVTFVRNRTLREGIIARKMAVDGIQERQGSALFQSRQSTWQMPAQRTGNFSTLQNSARLPHQRKEFLNVHQAGQKHQLRSDSEDTSEESEEEPAAKRPRKQSNLEYGSGILGRLQHRE